MTPRYLFFAFVFLLSGVAIAQTTPENRKVTPPATIDYEGKTLYHDTLRQDKDIYLEANIDDDPEPEVILGFTTTYKTPSKIEPREDVELFKVKKREIPLIENHAFFQIYNPGPGGHYKLIKTISGMERLGTVTLITPGQQEPPVIVFISPGADTYADVNVLRWRDHGLQRLLNEGGRPETILIQAASTPPALEVEKRRYVWNDAQENFILDTAPQEKSGKPLTDAL